MISLFIPAAVLLIAMIGSALFNSAPRERTDEERGQLMEDIARWRMVLSCPSAIYSSGDIQFTVKQCAHWPKSDQPQCVQLGRRRFPASLHYLLDCRRGLLDVHCNGDVCGTERPE